MQEAAEEVNAVLNSIRKEVQKRGIDNFGEQLTIFLGHKQFEAMMRIDRPQLQHIYDFHREKFMGHTIVRVMKDSFLHVSKV